jgi:hypothetical protein
MIAERRPDFIAFSCNYLANVPEIVDLAVATKIVVPHSFICVGGHSASFIAETILEHGEGPATDSSGGWGRGVGSHFINGGQNITFPA